MVGKTVSSARPVQTTGAATAVILVGLVLTSLSLPPYSAGDIFRVAAIGVGISLSLATAIEATAGVRNLIRVDLLMLWVLYLLTFMEFLFPQWGVDGSVRPVAAVNGTNVALVGFGGLVIGRHLVPRRTRAGYRSPFADVPPRSIFWLFIVATLLGYLHIFLAVNFDPFEVIRQMLQPRFSQAWSRGRVGGDLFSLLVEVGALIYLLPPIAGLVYARSKEYSPAQKFIVTIVLMFTIFNGFATGTRNVLGTYVITFFGAYYLNRPNITFARILAQGVPALLILLVGSAYMLQFRQSGASNFSFETAQLDTLSVDYNLIIISKLTEVFPSTYGFLGFELPFQAIIHPIPRILWPGKPEGLSVSIETALAADGASYTLAATFIGEAYISGGVLAVLIAGMLFGAGAELWNRVGRTIDSTFSQVLYASGFFCAMLVMRSITWGSVTVLPTLALWLYGKMFLGRSRQTRGMPQSAPKPSQSSCHSKITSTLRG